MCGIAGIVGQVGEENRAALARMSAAMLHRGPDAHGTWESPRGPDGNGVLLAHRRLAILDLSPAGIQPMTDPVTGHVIVFNGEIYNYRALRSELEAAGQHFDSSGDTAVMLRALAVQGDAAIASLRGMFAFAQWDPTARRLTLARDPLGIKPLYVARNPDPRGRWTLAFASELRPILASGLLGTPRLAPEAVASVVWNGFVTGPRTAVRGVDLLPAGHVLTVEDSGRTVTSRRTWSIPGRQPAATCTEEELGEVLQEDVRLHLASDVPLAVFLSGGIDSSAVANLARRANQGPVYSFTLAFEEKERNEGPFARRIAEAIGTEHTEVLLTEGQFVGSLEKALDSLDQPTFDGLNSYFMSLAIRQAGFTVALVGTGGDELFGGYTSFRDLPVLRRWARRTSFVPRQLLVAGALLATARLRRSGGAVPPQTRWAKLPAMVREGDDLLSSYQLAYALFLPEFQSELLDPDFARPLDDGLVEDRHRQLEDEVGDRSPLSSISVLEQRLFLGERLLRDNDVASMAASIEQRVPLVDPVLFQHVDRLPEETRYAPVGRKAILRRVGLKGLDPALFERPKSGFELPFDRWIRAGLRGAMDETLRDAGAVRAAGLQPATVARLWQAFLDGAPGMYWSRVWAIYTLVRWCSRNGVQR
jgi:asparagine synthase (glutamine-hydrolysing)